MVRAKLLFGWADSRFAKPRKFPKRERIVTFCIVQKVTKKHTGLRPATSIQSSAGNTLGEASDGTSRTRLFARNGGEKALNRCEVPALQRKELERTTKEWPCSFADSRLWLGGNLRCWLRKLATFVDSNMACSNRRCFGCEKGLFFQLMQDNLEKKGFWVTKKQRFQFVQSQPIKKSFFSAHKNFNFPPHPN